MKSGTCPKCGSHEVYTCNPGSGIYLSDPHKIYLRTEPPRFWGAREELKPETYLCMNCGNFELYVSAELRQQITSPENFEKFLKLWRRVT